MFEAVGSLLSEVVADKPEYKAADFRPRVVCVLVNPHRKWAGLGVWQNDHRIIIVSFKFTVTIASKLFAFKVEILENVQSYSFSQIHSHIAILLLLFLLIIIYQMSAREQ